MFENVLVGADDSATALRAVATAVDLAKAIGAKLHVVTAYRAETVAPAHLFLASAGYPMGMIPVDAENPADAAKELLDRLRRLADEAGVNSDFHSVAGEPAGAIVSAAEQLGADLIVVGNKGMRGARKVLGSVPNSIAHHAPCSVLIVDTSDPA